MKRRQAIKYIISFPWSFCYSNCYWLLKSLKCFRIPKTRNPAQNSTYRSRWIMGLNEIKNEVENIKMIYIYFVIFMRWLLILTVCVNNSLLPWRIIGIIVALPVQRIYCFIFLLFFHVLILIQSVEVSKHFVDNPLLFQSFIAYNWRSQLVS